MHAVIVTSVGVVRPRLSVASFALLRHDRHVDLLLSVLALHKDALLDL